MGNCAGIKQKVNESDKTQTDTSRANNISIKQKTKQLTAQISQPQKIKMPKQMLLQQLYQLVKHDIRQRQLGVQGIIRAINLQGQGLFFKCQDGLLRKFLNKEKDIINNKNLWFKGKIILIVARTKNVQQQLKNQIHKFAQLAEFANKSYWISNNDKQITQTLSFMFSQKQPQFSIQRSIYQRQSFIGIRLPSLLVSQKFNIYLQIKSQFQKNKNPSDIYFKANLEIKNFVSDPVPNVIIDICKRRQNVLILVTNPLQWVTTSSLVFNIVSQQLGLRPDILYRYNIPHINSLNDKIAIQSNKFKPIPFKTSPPKINLKTQINQSLYIPPQIKKIANKFLKQQPRQMKIDLNSYKFVHGVYKTKMAIDIAIKLVTNIYDQSQQYRIVKSKNPTITQYFTSSQEGLQFLYDIGFQKHIQQTMINRQPQSRLRSIKEALLKIDNK